MSFPTSSSPSSRAPSAVLRQQQQQSSPTTAPSADKAIYTSASHLYPLVAPPNALRLLGELLLHEQRVEAVCALQDSHCNQELEANQARMRLLRHQRERRRQVRAAYTEANAAMAAMADEVVLAVRDRRSTLQPDGYQALIFSNGDVYEGTWRNSRMHGRGCFLRQDRQEVYEGQWFLGLRCGSGTAHAPQHGFTYSGSWLDGFWHGHGVLIEAEGTFTGDVVMGELHGQGTYAYRSGHVYKGQWCDGLFDGVGTYLYPSGASYTGEWQAGLECGFGSMTYASGEVYAGQWRAGRPHGQGVYRSPTHEVDGLWLYGQVHGKARCAFADGSCYVGEWRRSRPHGVGTFTSATDGAEYAGEFCNGRRHGRGCYRSERVCFEGMWCDDVKQGPSGSITLSGAGTFRGAWRGDHLCDQCAYDCDGRLSVFTLTPQLVCSSVTTQPVVRGVDLHLGGEGSSSLKPSREALQGTRAADARGAAKADGTYDEGQRFSVDAAIAEL